MTDRGRKYEHKLASLVAKQTDEELIPLATGYNGAYSRDVDLLIDDGEAVHAFELKKTSKDAKTLNWDTKDVQKDDIYGLMRFCVEYPRPTYPYIGVRFGRRSLAITRLYINDYPNVNDVLENAVKLSPIEAKHTSSDNLRFYKPEAEDWDTVKLDQHDVQNLMDAIGYQF